MSLPVPHLIRDFCLNLFCRRRNGPDLIDELVDVLMGCNILTFCLQVAAEVCASSGGYERNQRQCPSEIHLAPILDQGFVHMAFIHRTLIVKSMEALQTVELHRVPHSPDLEKPGDFAFIPKREPIRE